MSCYEKLDLLFSFINMCIIIYFSYIFQVKFSDSSQVKEMLNNELLKIETLVEILLYSEENRTKYLINKRRISNILYYLSKDKHSKFLKLNDISDLKSEFENLAISLEAEDGEHEKYKTNIFNKILSIRSSIYHF
jgi:hypothetical protein